MKPATVVAALVAIFSMVPGFAQETEWRIAPYAWIAGLDGTVGVGDRTGGDRLDGNFGQLSSNMELGGAMLYADWRRGRWSVFGDWTYVKVESNASSPLGLLYGGLDGEVKGHVVQGAAGYEIHSEGGSRVDALAGIRFYDLDGTVALQPGLLAGRRASQRKSWADGVAGLRWQARLSDHWDLGLYGDVGKGGSDFTWQAFASIGYRFSWGSIVGGWRHLYVDYDEDNLRIDAAITGPFLGAMFRF